MCTDLWDNNFEILHSEVALDKVELVCEETVKSKPTGNDSGFIIYLNPIYSSVIWLENSGYLIIQLKKIVKNRLSNGLKIGRTKNLQAW